VGNPVLDIADTRTIGIEVTRLDVGGLVDRGEAGRLARVHQIERHFGLAVDHHGLAGRRMHVDAMPRAAEGEFDAMVDQPFAVGAGAGVDFIEQRHGAFLEQAGADAAKHVFRGLALDNDIVDAVKMKKLP
jgi:hypothetical protein